MLNLDVLMIAFAVFVVVGMTLLGVGVGLFIASQKESKRKAEQPTKPVIVSSYWREEASIDC